MNAQQLKNSILQEAIEGRLVPQDPNDEPASVLLERIRKEKAKLVKEGKLKKKDLEETPISKEEIPFEIPKGWEWVRLKTLSKAIHYGYTASSAPSGNAKLLRITDIQDDKVDWSTVPFCTIKEKDLTTYQLQNRDILIARTGGTVGKTYIVRELEEVSVFASYLIRAIPLESIDEEYIKLFMASPCYWSQLTDAATGTGQPNVNGQSLSNLILPLPPLAEQHRIVAKIEELLPKVEAYGKAQEALDKLNADLPEQLKKSILREAIEGRLVPQDPNEEPTSVLLDNIRKEKKRLVKEGKLKKKDLEETPISEKEMPNPKVTGWEYVRLSFVTSLIEGEKLEGDYVCLDAKYLRGKSSGDMLSRGRFVKQGDNIILVDGENSGEVFTVPCDGYMGSTFKQLWVSDSMYLPYILCYIRYYKDILRNNKKGAAIPHLNKEIFANLVLGIPPLQEQHRIVLKIEQLLNKINQLKEEK